MSSLTELIDIIPASSEESAEDIFASAPGFLFPDDLRNNHGDPGDEIIYKSRRFGHISLLTADPKREDERKLFSHYLWNAGVLMAERLSGERLISEQERHDWNVDGQSVLELGAGVGLAGILATLAGATRVVISDYPAPVVLTNIENNVKKNIPEKLRQNVDVEGHEWGSFKTGFTERNKSSFDRVIAADCFWMPWQHHNLIQSMLYFLSTSSEAKILAIGGFHTGRENLTLFFKTAQEEGLHIEEIYEEDDKGVRSTWLDEQDQGREDPTARKKWLCVARLKRKD